MSIRFMFHLSQCPDFNFVDYISSSIKQINCGTMLNLSSLKKTKKTNKLLNESKGKAISYYVSLLDYFLGNKVALMVQIRENVATFFLISAVSTTL